MDKKMNKVGFYNEKTLMELTPFLEDIFVGIEEESYQVVPHPEGGGDGWIYLSDKAIGYLKTHNDHECTASPEDGCDFCYKLQLLGLLPDPDLDKDEPDEEKETERIENIADGLREDGAI